MVVTEEECGQLLLADADVGGGFIHAAEWQKVATVADPPVQCTRCTYVETASDRRLAQFLSDSLKGRESCGERILQSILRRKRSSSFFIRMTFVC